jgi:hypothetical protein
MRRRYGLYALAALRPLGYLEPCLEYDCTHVIVREQRLHAGIALYPFPQHRANRNLRLKSELGYGRPQRAKRTVVWFCQLTTGF